MSPKCWVVVGESERLMCCVVLCCAVLCCVVLCAWCSGAEPAWLGGRHLPGRFLRAAGCGWAQYLEAVEIQNVPQAIPFPQLWLSIPTRKIWNVLFRSQTEGICNCSFKSSLVRGWLTFDPFFPEASGCQQPSANLHHIQPQTQPGPVRHSGRF